MMWASIDSNGCVIQLVARVAEPYFFKWVDLPVETPLRTSDGVLKYKLNGDAIVERSEADIAKDLSEMKSMPTTPERIDALEAAVLEMILGGGM